MGDSSHRLGPRLGRLHAYRDRGAIYVEGLRTSAQAAILTAGVAKGADFTGTAWAIGLGVGLFVLLEAAKIALGALDYGLGVYQNQTRIQGEANPVMMRMVDALERRETRP